MQVNSEKYYFTYTDKYSVCSIKIQEKAVSGYLYLHQNKQRSKQVRKILPAQDKFTAELSGIILNLLRVTD